MVRVNEGEITGNLEILNRVCTGGSCREPIASPKAHIEQLSKGAVYPICWHYYGLGFYLVVYKGLPRDSYPKP